MEKPVVEAVSTSNPYVISWTSEAQIHCHRLPAFTEMNFSRHLLESNMYLEQRIKNSVNAYLIHKNMDEGYLIHKNMDEGYLIHKNIDINSLVDHVMKENKYEESIRDTVTKVINDMLRETELPPPTRHFTAKT
jgi:hypothetical protein